MSRERADDQQECVSSQAAKQLSQANISRARPALMDFPVKMQV